ncbi:MAG TPA: type II toxin-antitoxin system mRNA interferase toxin, RelE/StbE family [Candidatus Nanoarchaeia archaeon]|nr:type II toxin-antitoxin system mRNA interferase toxin, RelE/StbE family [Candidatus Nanoarchaeia archaeon]
MYKIYTASPKVERKLNAYLVLRNDVKYKLDKLREDPRRNCGAHPLKGELSGRWACWLGSNIRMIYRIDDLNKIIEVLVVGTHKVY